MNKEKKIKWDLSKAPKIPNYSDNNKNIVEVELDFNDKRKIQNIKLLEQKYLN